MLLSTRDSYSAVNSATKTAGNWLNCTTFCFEHKHQEISFQITPSFRGFLQKGREVIWKSLTFPIEKKNVKIFPLRGKEGGGFGRNFPDTKRLERNYQLHLMISVSIVQFLLLQKFIVACKTWLNVFENFRNFLNFLQKLAQLEKIEVTRERKTFFVWLDFYTPFTLLACAKSLGSTKVFCFWNKIFDPEKRANLHSKKFLCSIS